MLNTNSPPWPTGLTRDARRNEPSATAYLRPTMPAVRPALGPRRAPPQHRHTRLTCARRSCWGDGIGQPDSLFPTTSRSPDVGLLGHRHLHLEGLHELDLLGIATE